MDDFTDFGTDYGQREPLTRRIRNLLKDYPDGLPVPKELIQNADDAQASECCLLLDLRRHSTDNLINAKVKGFQGPALVFWNNQTFSPADFQNLCEFGGETKLEDRKKVGKFGLGFNSVYNLTDLPQFVSGEHFCVLDPHEKYFNGKRGKMFKLNESIPESTQSVAEKIEGQLKPFDNLFGFLTERVSRGLKYEGTIFRFPLRTEENALVSDICKNPYTTEEALQLIEMTKEHANLFLLFLQFVDNFRLAVWYEGETQFQSLSMYERTFRNGSSNCAQVLFGDQDCFSRSFQICIHDRIAGTEAPWDIFVESPGDKSSDGTRSIGAIAFPSVDLNLMTNTKSKLLFCFLPLPMPPNTGLPFLVNATFAVTSSRRYLEFSTMDDKSRGAKSNNGAWNRALIEKAVVPALCAAVLDTSRTHRPEHLFNLFPTFSLIAEPLMETLISSFYAKLTHDSNMKVFLSKKSRTYHALGERDTFIFSELIPMDIQNALIQCSFVLSTNQIWLQLAPRVLSALRTFTAQLCDQKIKTMEFFLNELMPRIHQILNSGSNYIDNAYKVLLYALENHHMSSDVKRCLSQYAWIITANCNVNTNSILNLKKPCELVRTDGTAASLLSFTNEFFPSEVVSLQSVHFDILCHPSFGMFSNCLPLAAIKAIVCHLNNPVFSISDYRDRFSKFATHLNDQQVHYRQRLRELQSILNSLEILTDYPGTELKPHEDVYQQELHILVSCLFSVCDFSRLGVHQNSFFNQALVLYKKPSYDVLLANLEAVVYNIEKAFSEKGQTVVKILSYIQNNHQTYVQSFAREVQKNALIPSNKERVFCKSSQICLTQNSPTLNGHLYAVSTVVAANNSASSLLTSCGVQKFFPTSKYVDVLNSLKKITEEQVIEVRSILEFLRNNRVHRDVKFPGVDGIMHEANDLCLNDYELQGSSTASLNRQLKYCHAAIPHDLALHFGVRTKRQMILQNHTTSIFRPFCQSESLSNRLRRIMQSYSNDMDIFKELIQNADDACASEIHFILDMRNLQKIQVLDMGWEQLMEPALLIFNNAYFTSGDMKGIQNLGEGSKRNANAKIGKFGVGFNCVYKLTDYPTFLTQVDGRGSGNLCVLDPCCFLLNQGGCQVDVTPDLRNNFPDSFSGFFVGEPCMNALEGKTMLRLPLRKRRSELSEHLPNVENITTKLKQLARRSQQLLMFLQNLTSLKVSFLNESGLETFCVCNKIVNDFTSTLSSFKGQVRDYQDDLHTINRSFAVGALYEVRIECELEGVEQELKKWLISEQVGSSVVADQRLIRWHSQNDSPPRRHGAVALPIHSLSGIDTCMFFCYLPIEETTHAASNESIKLPVFVNGQFFLGESRRVIELNHSEQKGLWNAYVLQNIVGPAYGNLVRHIITLYDQGRMDFEIEKYLSMFPSFKPGNNTISDHSITYFISKGLLESLQNIPFVPSLDLNNFLQEFRSVNAVFNLTSLQISMHRQQSALSKLTCLVIRLSIPMTKIPESHYRLWHQCDVELQDIEPSHVLNVLNQEVRPPVSIRETPLSDKSTLLCFINWAHDCIINHNNTDSLPIFLSAGGTLYDNSTSTRLFSNDMSLLEVFPDLADQLLDLDVERKLRTLNISCKMGLNDFMENLRKFYPLVCNGLTSKITNTISGIPSTEYLEQWVCHIWDYLCQNGAETHPFMDQLSILLCRNVRNNQFLVPISKGRICVFAKLSTLSIGTVKIELSNYECFFALTSSLYNPLTRGPRYSFISNLVFSDRNDPDFFVKILNVINETHGFESFSSTMREQLKNYFYTSYDNQSLRRDPAVLQTLRSLPIHLTLNGTYESLSGPQRVYSIPDDMPRDGVYCGETLADKFVLEEASPGKKDLQRRMGVVPKTTAQFYVEFIIPFLLPNGNDTIVQIHLKHLSAKFESDLDTYERNAIIAAIEQIEFVQNTDNEKTNLHNLFDATNFFYNKFKHSSELVHSKYTRLLPFLRKCGLKHKVTKNELWHFIDLLAGKFIQFESKIESEDCKTMKNVVEEFEKSEYNQTDYNNLKALHLFETEKHGVQPLNNCFDHEFFDLVEHVAPVLSQRFAEIVSTRSIFVGSIFKRSLFRAETSRVKQFWINEKGDDFEPSVSLVYQNVTKLCSFRSADKRKIFACLKYLCDRTTSMEQHGIKELSKLPCIEVENCETMLPPRQVSKVINCQCRDFQTEGKCILTEYLDAPTDQYLQLWVLLKICGATDLYSLQQVIYVLETFKNEFQGEIRNNPNMPSKYASLERHFILFLKKCNRRELELLDNTQPVYLRSREGSLVDIRSCVFIDDDNFFRVVTSKVNNFERFIPTKRILEITNVTNEIDSLPTSMRPKFFREIAVVSIDSSSYNVENSSSEDFDMNAVSEKMKNGDFHDRCARVLQTDLEDLIGHFQGSISRNHLGTEIKKLNQMSTILLTPVKKLFLKCEINLENNTSSDFIFESRKIYVTRGTRSNIVFVYNEDRQMNKKVLHLVVKQILQLCDILDASTEQINLIGYILFHAKSEEEEKMQLLEEGVHLRPDPEEDSFIAQKRCIGTTVPFPLHAIIEHNPFRKFRKDEFVAIKVSSIGDEDIFNCGQFVGEESPPDYSTDPITMARLRIIVDSRNNVEIVDGSKVFGFKEKPDEESGSITSNNQSSNETMEEDLGKMSQIIWNACQNCEDVHSLRKNLNEINTRLVESVMSKYRSPEEQQALTRSLTQMISQEIEKARAEQSRQTNNRNEASNDNLRQYSRCEEIVQNFVVQHFQRMTREIEAFDNYQRAHVSTSTSASNQRPRHIHCPIENLIRNSVAYKGPHPGLAQLWLKQASEDLENLNLLCNGTTTSQITNPWTFDMSIKVIENSLVAVLMTHNSSIAPQFIGKLGETYNIKDVFEWIISHCIEHLRAETKNCLKRILNDVIFLMVSHKGQLHRPDTVEMRTSRWAIPLEKTSIMVKHCREMFTVVEKTVNRR